jgi:single-strand DNA-binding protein
MANSYNKIILVGRVGRDAELRATPKGTYVAKTGLAVEDTAKKRSEGGFETEWYQIAVFGRQAETLAPMLKKGTLILVEGRLSIRTYEDRDKRFRYSPDVSADRVVLLGSPGGQGAGAQRGESHPVDELDQAPADINADDIPF